MISDDGLDQNLEDCLWRRRRKWLRAVSSLFGLADSVPEYNFCAVLFITKTSFVLCYNSHIGKETLCGPWLIVR